MYKVTSLKIVGPYTLELGFDDGAIQIVDFASVLFGEMLHPLRDLTLFNSVRIDPEIHTIVWANGADFDPALLRHWEEHVDELSRRAQEWESIER
ncbi:MAG: DUF2442 domain-containing protein [Ignavibacteriae bacterium]|nr:DUF2442 domain-containing protein [Ignavibacteriota bacterium]